ncbi:MAG: hypothetical protein U0930_11465 [Pirellulales bacterium]
MSQPKSIGVTTLVFLFVVVLADIVLVSLGANGPYPLIQGVEAIVFASVTGFAIGQIVCVLIWSGLKGNSWIRSFFQALVASTTVIFLMALTLRLASPDGPKSWSEPLKLILYMPLMTVAGSLPLWMMRYLFHWRLMTEVSQSKNETSKSVSVEDILLLTATVAGALMMSRAPGDIQLSNSQSAITAWQNFLIGAIVFSAALTPFTIGSAWLFFRSHSGIGRTAKILAFGFFTWIVLSFILSLFSPGGSTGELIGILFVLLLFGFGTLLAGLSSLAVDGIVLPKQTMQLAKSMGETVESRHTHTSSNQHAGSDVQFITDQAIGDPLAAEEPTRFFSRDEVSYRKSKVLDRVLVGFLVLLALIFTAIGQKRVSALIAVEQARENSLNTLREQSIELVAKGQFVDSFRAKPTADDSIASDLEKWSRLKVVDLSGCRNITNLGAAKIARIPRLERLILDGTSVSDGLFANLNPGEVTLKELDLSHTKISISGIKQSFEFVRSQKLSLRGMNLTDDDLKQLESLSCTGWDLRDNPLAIVPANATSLTLGNNNVSLRQLSNLANILSTLKIDGLQLSDDEFIGVCQQLHSLRVLSLSNTGLTDKSLNFIATLSSLESLEIGPGNFTGNGFDPSGMGLARLKISHPSLDLSLLTKLTPILVMVDLSGSGVTDADISSIRTLKFVSYNLDRTHVTTKGIIHLAGLDSREISIRGTAITPADFEKIKSQTNFCTFIVDDKVFTQEVKRRIQNGSALQFENQMRNNFDSEY